MLTVKEVAKQLNVSAGFVYKLAETGRIVSYKIGSATRFKQQDVDTFLESCKCQKASSDQSIRVSLRRLRI
jgi:excisionase family DNA binding protein